MGIESGEHARSNARPPQPDLQYHLPGWARTYALIFGLVWTFLMFYAVVSSVAARSPEAFLALLLLAAGMFLSYRWAQISLASDADHLTIRNLFRTYRLPIAQVNGFRLSRRLLDSFFPSVRVELRNRRAITLSVFATRWGGGSARKTRERVEILQSWLRSGDG